MNRLYASLLLLTLTSNAIAQDSLFGVSPTTIVDKEGKERRLYHLNMETAELFGNSTDLQYFFIHLYVGENYE